MWTLSEEGSRTGKIFVEDVIASEETVTATLNVNDVCMINMSITSINKPLLLKHIMQLHEQVIELSDFISFNVGFCNKLLIQVFT